MRRMDGGTRGRNFIKWAYENGYDENAPKGKCTIERKDINGNYCPENCCFITQAEQMNNTTRNIWIEYNGERKTVAQWSRETGIKSATISGRLAHGWSAEKILTEPVRKRAK